MPDSKKLAKALAEIAKMHGRGSVFRQEFGKYPAVEVISTGSLAVDLAIGTEGRNCGIPRGRITQLFGQPSGGKTTMALHVVANVQSSGGVVAYVDAEHGFDQFYARAMGVNVDELHMCEPSNFESMADIVERLIMSESMSLIVIDSIAAPLGKAEIEGEIGDAHPGLRARLISQFIGKVWGPVKETGTTLLIINQIREKIGGFGFGPKTDTPGGKALKHSISLSLEVSHIGQLKYRDTVVGSRTKVRVAKSKLGPPFRVAEFDLIYGQGFSKAGELIDLGLKYGLLSRSEGSSINFNGQPLGRGREAARNALEANSNGLCQSLYDQIWRAASASPDVGNGQGEEGEESE